MERQNVTEDGIFSEKTNVIWKGKVYMMSEKVQIIRLQMVKDSDIIYGKRKMENPKEAAALIKGFLGEANRECAVVCAMDTKMKPTHIQLVSMGAVNYCPVSIPEVFKAALLSNATNILLFHLCYSHHS